MAQAPVSRMKKKDIIDLSRRKCKHNHSIIGYHCQSWDGCPEERIGFLDIETTDFKADRGIVICYCLRDLKTRKVYSAKISGKDMLSQNKDKKVLRQFLKDLSGFDRVITFYGKGFDVPFLRTRALIRGLEFPFYGEITHDDIYFIARSKLRLSRNSQENVAKMITGRTEKTHFDFKVWEAARDGKVWAINKVYIHNLKDINDLERIYHKIINFSRKQNSSI